VLEIGKVNTLEVSRETGSGFYLKVPESFGDVFLPPSMAPEFTKIGDMIDVFIYPDSKDSLIATCRLPHAVVGEYALLDCIDVQEFGAFFDLGIEKDLLVPGNEQRQNVELHNEYLVRICLDDTDRVFGTTKIGDYILDSKFDIATGDKVSMVPAERTDMGYRVIINKKFIGMIYNSEIFKPVKIGVEIQGFVKKLREDGLVDCALQIQGIKNLDHSTIKIMGMLIKNGGKSRLHDKSSPEDIKFALGMSKKTFKNAIGMLYKKKKILITKDGIEVVKKSHE
jgi:predicted RNA-binding protein (virulence factor B family)